MLSEGGHSLGHRDPSEARTDRVRTVTVPSKPGGCRYLLREFDPSTTQAPLLVNYGKTQHAAIANIRIVYLLFYILSRLTHILIGITTMIL